MSGPGNLPSETQALIVGAGPIGLVMAMELAWRGVPCMIIEQGDGTVDLPRGAMVSVRTMEYCRRWGITGQVAAAGFPQDYRLDMVYCTSLAGYLLERDPYPSMREREPPPQSPEKRTWCPQPMFDPMLAREVARLGGTTMRYHCRLEGFEQGADTVLARTIDERSGERREIAARYLIGCDGAGSFVREATGIGQDGEFLGYSINIFFRCPGLLEAHDKGEAERYLFVDATGTWGNITVVDGHSTWRLTVIGGKERFDLETFDAAAHVRRAIGRDDVPFELIAVKPWRRSQALAHRFRQGRVLLAGDSAHTMSPTGGFGMNTGCIDAVNLGWKLEAVLAGWGGEHLLDSYTAEQVPVVLRNSAASTSNYDLWVGVRAISGSVLEPTDAGGQARSEVGRRLKESLREEWECLGVMLGYRYDASPICIDDHSPAPPDPVSEYFPSARPGARAPHAWLPDGRSTLDLFGRGFVLLHFGGTLDGADRLLAAARQQAVPIRREDITQPDIAALYERRLVLVRPDGHVAWRGDVPPADIPAVISAIRGGSCAERRE